MIVPVEASFTRSVVFRGPKALSNPLSSEGTKWS
jgi:hypothetical protein